MRNLRQLRSAFALAILIGAGMVFSGPTLHAQAPGSGKSTAVRCALLQSAIAAVGADSALGQYLQGIYDANCSAL